MSGLMSPFSVFARRGLMAVGHDVPSEKLKQLHDLEAKFFVCHPSMEHFGVKEENLAFDDVILAEYTTFLDVMRGASIQMYP
jgi:peroxiredoxin family protein